MPEFTRMDSHAAIVSFWNEQGEALPRDLRQTLQSVIAGADARAAIIAGMEALYAARGQLTEEGTALLGGLARFVAEKNFYGKGARASQIAAVADRIAAGGEAEAGGDPPTEQGQRD